MLFLITSSVLLFCSCTSRPTSVDKEAPKPEAAHTLEGKWVIRQPLGSSELLLLSHDTYHPELAKYHYLTFDLKKNTIKTRAAGEFGLADGYSPALDLRQLKWSLKGDTLHIYGRYSDVSGSYAFNSFYKVSHKGDTLSLKQQKM